MSTFKGSLTVTELNLRSLPARSAGSLVIVIGIATVVAVLIVVLAMSRGFIAAATSGGRFERVIVLPRGANSESSGFISRDQVRTVLNAPGIRKDTQGRPVASAEHFAFVLAPDLRTGRDSFVVVRGVGPQASALRPEIRLTEGRMFKPGLSEVIAGRAARSRLADVKVGGKIIMPQGQWTIVGMFESNGDARESELLTDADALISAMRRDVFNSVTVWIDGDAEFRAFKEFVTTDPNLSVELKRETDWLRETSRPIGRLLTLIAYAIGGFMALGAVFGALNTMYSATSARTLEIATLRAIGFGGSSVVVSILSEILLLAAAGAGLGAAVAWLFFNGNYVSTATGTNAAQLTFALNVTPGLMAVAFTCALGIGILGGLFPAIRAIRVPVADALRG